MFFALVTSTKCSLLSDVNRSTWTVVSARSLEESGKSREFGSGRHVEEIGRPDCDLRESESVVYNDSNAGGTDGNGQKRDGVSLLLLEFIVITACRYFSCVKTKAH